MLEHSWFGPRCAVISLNHRFDGGRVAVRTVEGTLNGTEAPEKGLGSASVLRNGATPEAARVRPTGAIRPLQVRQRPSTAFVKDIRTSGCTGLTGRNNRASGRCLLFTGRQMVSTAASRSSAVAQVSSHELTKAKPRPLKTTKDNYSERSQEQLKQRRCLPLTSLGGTCKFAHRELGVLEDVGNPMARVASRVPRGNQTGI
jgi:hypothetical protein